MRELIKKDKVNIFILIVIFIAISAFGLFKYFEYKEKKRSLYLAVQMCGFKHTTVELEMLAEKLGGTAEAYKAVTAAASAGFTGELLSNTAELGTKLEKSGGSADQLVSKTLAIGGRR